MNYKDIKAAFPDYPWEKVSVRKCKSCSCYKGINTETTKHFCDVWPEKPKECYGYGEKKKYDSNT